MPIKLIDDEGAGERASTRVCSGLNVATGMRRVILLLCWCVLTLPIDARAADALGEMRLFYTAAERLSKAARNAQAGAAAGDIDPSPRSESASVVPSGASASPRQDHNQEARDAVAVGDRNEAPAEGKSAIKRENRRVRRSGFRVAAILGNQADVQVLIGDQLCRTRKGLELHCIRKPDGVRMLAWEAVSERVIVVPERGNVARLAVGEQWQP